MRWLAIGLPVLGSWATAAHESAPVSIEIVAPDGVAFHEFRPARATVRCAPIYRPRTAPVTGERHIDQAVTAEFVAQSNPDGRHFIKYEWRQTLCRKRIVDCGEHNRFWDESTPGFAPPPPRR